MGEITVERINVVDANGTLRLVISDRDRMHPGVVSGKTLDRQRRPKGGATRLCRQGRLPWATF